MKGNKVLVVATTLAVCLGWAGVATAQDRNPRFPTINRDASPAIQDSTPKANPSIETKPELAGQIHILKADLTCGISSLKTQCSGVGGPFSCWPVAIPNGWEGDVRHDLTLDLSVNNKGFAEAKDFSVTISLGKKSDRVRVGELRRMNPKTETLSLPKNSVHMFREKVDLAVGETAVIQAGMGVDSGNVVDETNETNNSCSYRITVHRVE